MIIVVIASLILCCYWAYWAASWRKLDQLTAKLPVPSGLPIIGHATLFVGNTEKILKNLEDIAELAFEHQGVVKLWLGPKLYIAIGNAEDAQVVLENCLDKDSVYRFLRPWLGQGLFIAPLGLWKIHRRVLLPVFHNKVVEEYLKIISNQADVLLDRLSEQSGKTEFDVLRYITACTLDIVFETAMGERMDVQHSPDTPYLRARHTVMTILNKRLFKVWLQPDCLFNLTPYAKQQKENIELTHKFTDEVVRKRRLHYETNKNQNTNRQSGSIFLWILLPTKHLPSAKLISILAYLFAINGHEEQWALHKRVNYDYLSSLAYWISEQVDGKIQAVLDMLFGREIDFTDEQLREHIDSITIAGNDTTALVVAYTLVLLGIHQGAQERAFQEQRSIFDNSKRGATKEDLLSMNYLERVIKESMRLYTVVPIIARNVDKEIYLPHSKVTIPAGVGAVVGAFAVHRSVDDWGSNANEFDPDRFLPERSADRHPAAFIPFSFGSRNCIGRNFGMIIIKSIISSIIRAYKIEANEVGPLKVEVLLFPIRGHQIKITKR